MPREFTDKDVVTWACLLAYDGLTQKVENEEAARVEGEGDRFHVVCTPSGGAQTVRLQLKGDWEDALADEELLREIESAKR